MKKKWTSWAGTSLVTCTGAAIDTLPTIIVSPSSCPRRDWTKNIDFWYDAIVSSPSSYTGLLAPSFLHYFLEGVSEVFYDRKAPLIFSAVDYVDGVSTIVIG